MIWHRICAVVAVSLAICAGLLADQRHTIASAVVGFAALLFADPPGRAKR